MGRKSAAVSHTSLALLLGYISASGDQWKFPYAECPAVGPWGGMKEQQTDHDHPFLFQFILFSLCVACYIPRILFLKCAVLYYTYMQILYILLFVNRMSDYPTTFFSKCSVYNHNTLHIKTVSHATTQYTQILQYPVWKIFDQTAQVLKG